MDTHTSTDYTKFKRFKDNLNREIQETAVKQLVESFTQTFNDKEPFVKVTKKMEIIDGQHRFEAAKRLGLPIVYQIDDNFKIDHLMNYQVQRPWSPSDYINHFAARGNECYKFVRDMSNKYNLSKTSTLSLIMGKHVKLPQLRSGKVSFDIREKIKLEDIVSKAHDTIYMLKNETNLRPTKFYKCSTFCKALRDLFLNEDLDHKRFLHKIKLYWTDIKPQETSEDYVSLLLKIYKKYNKKK